MSGQDTSDDPPPSDNGHSAGNSVTPLEYSSSEYSVPDGIGTADWFRKSAGTSDTSQSSSIIDGPRSSKASSQQRAVSDFHERRLNPKVARTRAGGQEKSTLEELSDRPKIDYKYRVHTKQTGNLYGLCDVVPYLLGPRSYLKAIASFGVHHVPLEAYQDQGGRLVLDPNAISALDRVFLAMLWLRRAPIVRRPANWEGLYAGMNVEDDQLIIYKDMGVDQEPKVEAMNHDDFLAKVVAWARLPNPARVAGDKPDFVTPWSLVADKIRKKGIAIGDIDQDLYSELVYMTEPQLDARLTRLLMGGELEKRKRQLAEKARKVAASDTFTYIMPQETNPNVMYANRFSHQHRTGYIVDTTAPVHRNVFETRGLDMDDKEKKVTNPTMDKVKRRCKATVNWALAFMVLFGCAVGIILIYHFKMGNKRNTSPSAGT